jgi:hypothetical protein
MSPLHDVTFRRFGIDAPKEMERLAMELVYTGAREIDAQAGEAQLNLIASGAVSSCAIYIDKLGLADRKRTVFIGVEATIDVRQPPTPGTLGGLLEMHRPLGALAAASIRDWRTHVPGFIGSKRIADRLRCTFNTAKQTPNYAQWISAPGESVAEFLLALVAAHRAITGG